MGLPKGPGSLGLVLVCPTGLGDGCRSFFFSTGLPNGTGAGSFLSMVCPKGPAVLA